MHRASLFLMGSIVGALVASGLDRVHAQGLAPGSFTVGIGRSIHDTQGLAATLSWLGVTSVRLDMPWSEIERTPGIYAMPAWIDRAVDEARAQGIETLAILAYGNAAYGGDKPRSSAAIDAYARYAAYVVAHFKGRVRLYDLWNEWETHTGNTTPGTADDYVALARKAFPAIKAADPQAIVLSGGMLGTALESGWFERFLQQGGLQVIDALSIHPYNYQKPASDCPERAIDQLVRIHDLAQRYAGSRAIKMYVTEMGFPTYTGKGGIPEKTVAVFLARFYLLASAHADIAGVWWYGLRDQGQAGDDKEQHFGVMDHSMAPKPAARALRDVAAVLAQVRRFRLASQGSRDGVMGQRPDGSTFTLSWDETRTDSDWLADLAAATRRPKSPSALKGDGN